MSETITGTFEELIKVKTGKGKKGPWTLWNIKVDGTRYGAGFDQPKAAVGDQVEFESEENENGYQEIVKGTFKVTKAATKEQSAATKASNGGGESPAARQNSIECQVALKAAVDFVGGYNGSLDPSSRLDLDASLKAVQKAYGVFVGCLSPAAAQSKPASDKAKPAAKKAEPPADEEESGDPDY